LQGFLRGSARVRLVYEAFRPVDSQCAIPPSWSLTAPIGNRTPSPPTPKIGDLLVWRISAPRERGSRPIRLALIGLDGRLGR
jgi:hypothetical protein